MANPFDEAEAELGQESANPFDQAIAEMRSTENVDERGIPIELGAAMSQQFSQAGEKLKKALTLQGAEFPTFAKTASQLRTGTSKGVLQEPTENLIEGLLQGVN